MKEAKGSNKDSYYNNVRLKLLTDSSKKKIK
jgi:hypothetical protein